MIARSSFVVSALGLSTVFSVLEEIILLLNSSAQTSAASASSIQHAHDHRSVELSFLSSRLLKVLLARCECVVALHRTRHGNASAGDASQRSLAILHTRTPLIE